MTGDLGEYRLFGLEPRKYYLSARYRQQNAFAEDRTAGGAVEQDYAATYYPGTSDPADAVAINAGAGEVVSGTDIALRRRTPCGFAAG